MTDLADGVVYSRSGLTYQAGLLEKAGLVTRAPSADDERSVTVTITDAGRALLAQVLPGHIEVHPPPALPATVTQRTPRPWPTCCRRCATTCARRHPVRQRLAAGGAKTLSCSPDGTKTAFPALGRRHTGAQVYVFP